MKRHKRKSFLQLRKDFRGMFSQEMFPNSSLPVEVMSKVHIASEIGFLKSNHLFVFIEFHVATRLTKDNANLPSMTRMDGRKVAACNSPDERTVQPSDV